MRYTFQKSRRAKSKEDFETWVESGITPTLNAFEGGDTRATTIIVDDGRTISWELQSRRIGRRWGDFCDSRRPRKPPYGYDEFGSK